MKATRMEARTDSAPPFFAFSMTFAVAVFCEFRICWYFETSARSNSPVVEGDR